MQRSSEKPPRKRSTQAGEVITTRKRQKPETVVLTHEEIRACLAEGRIVRAELEKRVEKMHQVSIEQRFSQAK